MRFASVFALPFLLVSCGRSELAPIVSEAIDSAPETVNETIPETETAPDADTGLDSALDSGPDITSCSFGTVSGNLFGTVVYFANGDSIPPGTYSIAYVGGCMKYNANQDWALNAYAPDVAATSGWWLVEGARANPIEMLPGTIGYIVGSGGFATYDECVAANLQDTPITVTFAGGTLGVWLQDEYYADNVTGPDNQTPQWSLMCVP